jgi:5-methylcytosine-specific restriction endonuclease McrA
MINMQTRKVTNDAAARRAKKKGAFVEYVDKRKLHNYFQGICGICDLPVPFKDCTIDHIVPLNKGGKHKYSNCQPAHSLCNHIKADHLEGEYDLQAGLERARKYREKKRNRAYRNVNGRACGTRPELRAA